MARKTPELPPLLPMYEEVVSVYRNTEVSRPCELPGSHELFAPDEGVDDQDAKDRAIKARVRCYGCPALLGCGIEALRHGDADVRGGLTERQRRAIRKKPAVQWGGLLLKTLRGQSGTVEKEYAQVLRKEKLAADRAAASDTNELVGNIA